MNEFVEQLALDLPKFMEASVQGKGRYPVKHHRCGRPAGPAWKRKKRNFISERTYVGRTADQKEKYAKEQPYYPDVPTDPSLSSGTDPSDSRRSWHRNGENQRKREQTATSWSRRCQRDHGADGQELLSRSRQRWKRIWRSPEV